MKLILCVIFCLGCSCTEKQEFNTSGLTIISDNMVSPEEIDIIVQLVEEETQAYYPDVVNITSIFAEHEINVEFINTQLALNCQIYKRGLSKCETYIDGLNHNGNEIYLEWRRCLAISALAHELLHSIEKYILGIWGDEVKKHTTPHFFDEGITDSNQTSIESQVRLRALCILKSCEYLTFQGYCNNDIFFPYPKL